jgi:hypothetical protein
MQSNTVVLVEKHYIPLDVYRQLYGGIQIPQQQLLQNVAQQSPSTTAATQPARQSASQGTRLFQSVLENFFPRSNDPVQTNNPSRSTARPTRSNDNTSGTPADTTTATMRRIIVNETNGTDDDSTVLVSLFLNNILGNISNVSATASSSTTGGLTTHQMDNNSNIYRFHQPTATETQYSESSNAVCSICSADFIDGEYIRQLNRCSHSFHRPCIDIWLAGHNNCPLCRTNVIADIDNID